MNIDELKPGPELDRLVAENVFGYKVFRWGDPDNLFVASSKSAFDYACNGDTLTCHTNMGKGFCFTMPNYSADIAAAWLVFERVFEIDPGRFRLGLSRDMFSGKYITILNTTMDRYDILAETAPLAICLAALKAVGVDKT